MEQLCPWEAAKYLIYSSNVPTLLFYSHIPAMVISLFLGLLVFYKSEKSKLGSTLLIICSLFSLWGFFDLILWATNSPNTVMFFWSLQILVEPLVYLMSFYLVYLFIKNQDLPFKWKLLGIVSYLPVIVFLPSSYSISGINLSDCTAVESFVAQYFTYALELIFIILIFILMDRESKKSVTTGRKKEIMTFALGVVVFLLAFSWGNLIGSFTDNWTIAQAGLIGMPIFVAFIAYLIVKFHTFNVKLFAAQALVWGLTILTGSEFFFVKNIINMILTGATLLAVIIFGYFLIRSVKKEIEQKEELAKLNTDLQNVIKQRESLVHLITHKVKGSFTRTKFLFAGMLDGTFGEISPEIKKRAQQGLDFDNGGIQTVDLVLNVANLQNGLIRYDMQKVNLKDILLKTIEEEKNEADSKGLKLENEIKDGDYDMTGDAIWLKEVVHNLISNSIKYTKEGKIMVSLEKNDNKILFSVKDTGLGITDEDKKNLFTEGGRGKDSIKVNVDSTGYGLYTVKLIVEAHKGRVWAESEGAGKGCQFYIELPTS